MDWKPNIPYVQADDVDGIQLPAPYHSQREADRFAVVRSLCGF